MWIYKNNKISSIDDMMYYTDGNEPFGFIYELTHLPSGKKYLGRKQLIYNRKRKIGKRETKRLKEEKKANGKKNWWIVPKTKYVKKESDWKEYYGSSKEVEELLTEGTEEDFKREILDFGYTKKHLNYLETKLLFVRGVIENPEYLNSNIQGKYFRKDIIDYI